MKKTAVVPFIFLIALSSLFAQEMEIEEQFTPLTQVHSLGITFSQSFKTMHEMIGDDRRDVKYNINSIGINYSGFSGGRLGFISDVSVLLPLTTTFESENSMKNSGFSLNYTGGVAWDLLFEKCAMMPYLGFHGDYTFISEDPLDENQSNHLLSFGLGIGARFFYMISENRGFSIGMKGLIDTVEYSSASYDTREIMFKIKRGYQINAAYSWRPQNKS